MPENHLVLRSSYPITPDRDFIERYEGDTSVDLPPTYRAAHWRMTVGHPEYLRALARYDQEVAEYEAKLPRHRKALAKWEEETRQVESANRKDQQKFQEGVAAHELWLGSRAAKSRFLRIYRFLKRRLRRELRRQESRIFWTRMGVMLEAATGFCSFLLPDRYTLAIRAMREHPMALPRRRYWLLLAALVASVLGAAAATATLGPSAIVPASLLVIWRANAFIADFINRVAITLYQLNGACEMPGGEVRSGFALYFEPSSVRRCDYFYSPIYRAKPEVNPYRDTAAVRNGAWHERQAPEKHRWPLLGGKDTRPEWPIEKLFEKDPFGQKPFRRAFLVLHYGLTRLLAAVALIVALGTFSGLPPVTPLIPFVSAAVVFAVTLYPFLAFSVRRRTRRLLRLFESEKQTLWFAYAARNRTAPRKLFKQATPEVPTLAEVVVPKMAEPPAELFAKLPESNYRGIFRVTGANVTTYEPVREMASHRLFAGGEECPHFALGGIAHRHRTRGADHIAFIGGSGGGKTTLINGLMADLMPLTHLRVAQLGQARLGSQALLHVSRHEWSRSFTHQAVVYNAKNESLPFLAGLGFKPGKNLYLLDPADSRCCAWDVAADINDRDSINGFAELIVPKGHGPDENANFFQSKARTLLIALINSLRNRAIERGERPTWTLRDLIAATRTKDLLRAALEFDDDPERTISSILGVNDRQADGAYGTLTQHLEALSLIASRWHQARKEGRVLSLSSWLKHFQNSVLVLPQTGDNEIDYGPLNRALFKRLTQLVLTHEHTMVEEPDGRMRPVKRLFVLDEIGEAGKLDALKRLLSEGRSFGAQVVLGLHQLSQLEEVYGDKGAESILGQFPYVAMLKQGDPRTAEWLTHRIGKWYATHRRTTYTYGVTEGETFQHSSSHGRSENESTTNGTSRSTSHTNGGSGGEGGGGSNWSVTHQTGSNFAEQKGYGETHSNSSSHGTSRSENRSVSRVDEQRLEPAIADGEFGSFPDPEEDGRIGGIFVSPTFPTYFHDASVAELRSRFPADDPSVPARLRWEDDDAVSRFKPWDDDDAERLGIELPDTEPEVDWNQEGPDLQLEGGSLFDW